MIKKILFSLGIFCAVFGFTEEKDFPTTIIDFNTRDPYAIPGYEEFDSQAQNFHPFNGARELIPFFVYLKNTYGIETAVETGTWKGDTAAFFGHLFENVFTIEINPKLFEEACTRLENSPNVCVCQGNSPDVLRDLLPHFSSQPILFYLDAHWYESWPLLQELEEISRTHRDNCIIVIDDFKVPGRSDVPYDCYSINACCCYEYICSHLSKVFTEYTFHFLIPKDVGLRAKFVAIPKKWNAKKPSC